MNKKQLTKAVSGISTMTLKQSAIAIEAMLETLSKSLEMGEVITLQGFGTFSIVNRTERKGVNPSTGKSMVIPAKKTVKFKTSIVVK